MAVTQRISEQAYQDLVLSDPDHHWELHNGQLREKPGMSWDHGDVIVLLSHLLMRQLDRRQFRLSVNDWRVRRAAANIFIPDLIVVPTVYGREFRGRPDKLAIFSDPLPLVVEVWSRSTGNYDIEAKIPEYQRRGDLEIWRIHPYEGTLTAWRRQPDGTYDETMHREGIVRPVALPEVTIDLAELFEDA